MTNLKFHYAPLHLETFPTFFEKFDAINLYLEMIAFFCHLAETEVSEKPLEGKYTVVDILTPLGSASSLKPLLRDYLPLLQEAASDYLSSEEDDYYSIKQNLEELREKCSMLVKKHDIQKIFPYNEYEITYIAILPGHKLKKLYIHQLIFEPNSRIKIEDHYAIRTEFYQELKELIEKKLVEHLEMPSYPNKPYEWRGENPHLEIAELLHALIGCRIAIKEDEKGSPAKFVKEFYNLFGLDDGPYHSKLQQIRNRKNKKSWLNELPEFINSLRERNQTTK